jgi:outer membrane protein, heavy metal efflux system
MKRMLLTYRLWLLTTTLLTSPLSLYGQTVQPSDIPSRSASDFLALRQGVTENELLTRALASNPTLLAQRQQIAMAKGGVTQARLRKNPTLALGGLKEVNGGDNSFNVGGMLPLELYGRRARRTEAAQNKEDATEQSVSDQERLLTGEVRTRFGEALASIRNLMFVEQLLRVNRKVSQADGRSRA